jgi:hypothetical protein
MSGRLTVFMRRYVESDAAKTAVGDLRKKHGKVGAAIGSSEDEIRIWAINKVARREAKKNKAKPQTG